MRESDLNAMQKEKVFSGARKSRLDLRAARVTEVC